MKIDLNLLPIFIAVAEESNFSKAAARLGVTRSAVSQGIRRLEDAFGTMLVMRTTRSVNLTEAGERLHKSLSLPLSGIDMDKNLSRMVEKGKLEAGVKDQVLARIKDSMKYEDCADADLVIEAIAEDMATKHEIFKLLDGICKPEAILATNTSSLSITEVAAVTNRPEKVIGTWNNGIILCCRGQRPFPAGSWTTLRWKTAHWCWTAWPGAAFCTAATPPRSLPCRRSAT